MMTVHATSKGNIVRETPDAALTVSSSLRPKLMIVVSEQLIQVHYAGKGVPVNSMARSQLVRTINNVNVDVPVESAIQTFA